jgi:hypothetical protein
VTDFVPDLNEEGEIDDPPAWYARVLAGTAARVEDADNE